MMWEHPRQHGKAIIQRVIRDAELRNGKHIHTMSARDGEMCQGGDSECPLFHIQLAEAMEAWCGT